MTTTAELKQSYRFDGLVHKASLGFKYWDTVEVTALGLKRDNPVYGVVVSMPSYNLEEDYPDDVSVVVGTTLYCLGSNEVKRLLVEQPSG